MLIGPTRSAAVEAGLRALLLPSLNECCIAASSLLVSTLRNHGCRPRYERLVGCYNHVVQPSLLWHQGAVGVSPGHSWNGLRAGKHLALHCSAGLPTRLHRQLSLTGTRAPGLSSNFGCRPRFKRLVGCYNLVVQL